MVNELMRGTVIDRSTEQNSAFASNYELAQDVIDRRRRAVVVDTLYLNEAAAIPSWMIPLLFITTRGLEGSHARRERFRSIDLAQTNSRSEQLIYESLKRRFPFPTTVLS